MGVMTWNGLTRLNMRLNSIFGIGLLFSACILGIEGEPLACSSCGEGTVTSFPASVETRVAVPWTFEWRKPRNSDCQQLFSPHLRQEAYYLCGSSDAGTTWDTMESLCGHPCQTVHTSEFNPLTGNWMDCGSNRRPNATTTDVQPVFFCCKRLNIPPTVSAAPKYYRAFTARVDNNIPVLAQKYTVHTLADMLKTINGSEVSTVPKLENNHYSQQTEFVQNAKETAWLQLVALGLVHNSTVPSTPFPPYTSVEQVVGTSLPEEGITRIVVKDGEVVSSTDSLKLPTEDYDAILQFGGKTLWTATVRPTIPDEARDVIVAFMFPLYPEITSHRHPRLVEVSSFGEYVTLDGIIAGNDVWYSYGSSALADLDLRPAQTKPISCFDQSVDAARLCLEDYLHCSIDSDCVSQDACSRHGVVDCFLYDDLIWTSHDEDIYGAASCKPPLEIHPYLQEQYDKKLHWGGRPFCYRSESSDQFCDPGHAFTFYQPSCETTFDECVCRRCEAGTYAALGHAESCVACPEGQISDAGASSCESCLVGKHQNGTSCVDCGAGTWSNGAMSVCEECAKGYYGEDGTLCVRCRLGRYSDAERSTTCDTCPPGTSAPDNSMTACAPCMPGFFNDQHGMGACTPCPQGRYTAVGGHTSCVQCEIGKFSTIVGASICSACPAGTNTTGELRHVCTCDVGRYLSVAEAGQDCVLCPRGLYGDAVGLTRCFSCSHGRRGSYSNTVGASVCHKCELHTEYSDGKSCHVCPENMEPSIDQIGCSCASGFLASDNQCVRCPDGTFWIDESSCQTCPDGMVSVGEDRLTCAPCLSYQIAKQDDTGARRCESCPVGQIPHKAKSSCLDCEPGFFGIANATACEQCSQGSYQDEPGSPFCKSCPSQATTTPGELAPNVTSCYCEIGYYKPTGWPPEDDCVQCDSNLICNFREQPVARPGFWQREAAEGELLPMPIRCHPMEACIGSGCKEGYQSYACFECADRYFRLDSLCWECPEDESSWALFLFGALLLFGLVVLLNREVAPVSQGLIVIVINFVQMSALYPKFSIPWPHVLVSLFKIFSFASLDIQLLHPECSIDWDFKQKFTLVLLAGYIVIIVCAAVLYLYSLRKSKTRQLSLKDNMFSSITSVMFLCHLWIASSTLDFFDCTESADGNAYLDSDPSVMCQGDEWNSLLPLGVLSVAIFVVGVPIFYTVQIFRIRDQLHVRNVAYRYRFLLTRYQMRKSTFYWEIVIMVRKLSVAAFVDLKSSTPVTQSVLVMTVLFISALLQAHLQPYTHPELNTAEMLTLLSQVIMTFGGVVFLSDLLSDEEVTVLASTMAFMHSFVLVTTVGTAIYRFRVSREEKLQWVGKGMNEKQRDAVRAKIKLHARREAGDMPIAEMLQGLGSHDGMDRFVGELYGDLGKDVLIPDLNGKSKGEKLDTEVDNSPIDDALGGEAKRLEKEEAAAVKIQAAVRGRRVRKTTGSGARKSKKGVRPQIRSKVDMTKRSFLVKVTELTRSLEADGYSIRNVDAEKLYREVVDDHIAEEDWEMYIVSTLTQ